MLLCSCHKKPGKIKKTSILDILIHESSANGEMPAAKKFFLQLASRIRAATFELSSTEYNVATLASSTASSKDESRQLQIRADICTKGINLLLCVVSGVSFGVHLIENSYVENGPNLGLWPLYNFFRSYAFAKCIVDLLKNVPQVIEWVSARSAALSLLEV